MTLELDLDSSTSFRKFVRTNAFEEFQVIADISICHRQALRAR